MSAIRVLEKSELSQLEAKARSYFSAAMQNWQLFAETCLQIQSSGLWEAEGFDSWKEYCRARLPVGASRIRQYKAALPYAELLSQATGYKPSENQVRSLLQVVKDETKLIQVYKEAAKRTDEQPAKRHFEAVLGVVEETETTGAVSVGGLSMPATDVTLDSAMNEAVMEANLRFDEHKRRGKSTAINITLRRVNGSWQVNADGDLPDVVEMKYWRKDNGSISESNS